MTSTWKAIALWVLAATCAWAGPVGPVLKLPNHPDYWKSAGFVEMVGPLRLPTDGDETDIIQVWLKIPDGAQLSARRINDTRENRYTLVYPPGTIADRVEFDLSAGGIDDVRGASIDAGGRTVFHDYELAAGQDTDWIRGYEWLRSDDAADVAAGESLIGLFFPQASDSAKNHFRRLNHCGECHEADAPSPLTTAPPFRFQSDSRGFFQPLTVLQDEMTVRDHRSRDLNADDPFISVWCGDQRTQAVVSGKDRWYRCPHEQAPVGKLDLKSALAARDPHALALCRARAYLRSRMDALALDAFAPALAACGL